jgi:hypothetical protein
MNTDLQNDDLGILKIPSDLQTLVERLFRITGFVTVLCTPSDERPLAFSRYYHVRRVAWTAGLISKIRIADGDLVNINKVRWLAWAHDLNRWPFAHNAEKDLFDQAEDVPRYFKDNKIELEPNIITDLKGIISKSHTYLSKEAKIVLLADIITGFIEDPIWATTAIDLLPSFIPGQVNTHLCIGVEKPEIQQRLLKLNYLFFETRKVEPFETGFDLFFKGTVSKYIMERDIARSLPLGEKNFENWRRIVKENFMKNELFLYNNEKISHGSVLFNEIITPLYKKMGSSLSSTLTAINETQTIELAHKLNILEGLDDSRYLPTLDYVAKYEPQNSFRLNVPKSF